ncbi:hypothetical protein [uncultured Psychroserpens sp.]|uniref:fibronectin type III domain-containing protein n=1 Tax=uncultured Psychroserpens sp. TaxID=255436 RepID=UPI002638B8FE|nr:hypothetical protein [uncultured Psychroserpens sp.]
MKQYIYILALALIFSSCSSDDTSDPSNSNPSNFSANTTDLRFDGATIEWTDAIDPDGDNVTYAIILEGQEIASGGTTLVYSFSGLEPETNYEGYVEARDGNGGTSRADFFFTTEPEVIIMNVEIEYRSWTGAGGYGIVAYFEVPAVDNAVSYFLEILDYTPDVIPSNVGRTYSWTPDDNLPQGNNVGSGASHLVEYTPGIYHANTSTSSGPLSGFSDVENYYASIVANAQLTITVGE